MNPSELQYDAFLKRVQELERRLLKNEKDKEEIVSELRQAMKLAYDASQHAEDVLNSLKPENS